MTRQPRALQLTECAQLFATGETPRNISRASTPTTPAQAEGNFSEPWAVNDVLVRHYAAVVVDAKLSVSYLGAVL